MNENVFFARSMDTNATALTDQYASGVAAKHWNSFIGDHKNRTRHYKERLVGLLRQNGCKRILDVATGTGVDSIMLCEEGFHVTSTDASDKMLKEALKVRWARRKEDNFDRWVILEANWLTLTRDLGKIVGLGFDALICLGNSFPHVPDFNGDQQIQRTALQNFEKCVKPGGMLIIDHKNYDHILDFGTYPPKCIYLNYDNPSEVKTSVLHVDGVPKLVTIDLTFTKTDDDSDGEKANHNDCNGSSRSSTKDNKVSHCHLSSFPHRYKPFAALLAEVFPTNSKHTVLGDYQPLDEIPENDIPGYYIHVVNKPLNPVY